MQATQASKHLGIDISCLAFKRSGSARFNTFKSTEFEAEEKNLISSGAQLKVLKSFTQHSKAQLGKPIQNTLNTFQLTSGLLPIFPI